jgi:phosphoribosylamine--glycine ligase
MTNCLLLQNKFERLIMNVLLIGSGGREHALAWKIAQSPLLTHLFIAPGNAGTAQAGCNTPIEVNDFVETGKFALQEHIGMIVVGPEEPLVKGMVDYFAGHPELKHIPVIGPPAQGAQLEGSKDFAKEFMLRHGIPTAAYRSFTGGQETEAQDFIRSLQPPYVLKADGLAAGKGVVIVNAQEEAFTALREMFSGRFGAAGRKVVIEEFLSGIELSVFALTDGENYLLLPEAKDYKRAGEGDTGPNTGGMGAVSPVPFAGKEFMEKVETRIVRPTVEGLRKDGIPYKGFIFFGLINVNGNPMVIEYNVRMGDPETEAVIPRIENDLLELLQSVADGTLNRQTITVNPQTAATVMLVSGGYPGSYEKGKPIGGLKSTADCILFHAGTADHNGQAVTAGGRVIAVTAMADHVEAALAKSNANAEIVGYEGKYFRHDIGFDLK